MKTKTLALAASMLALATFQAQAAVNQLPAIQGPNGPVSADPVVQIGYDTITGLPCVVGKTVTCPGSGGAGGSSSPFLPTGVTTKVTAGSGSSVSGALSFAGPNLSVFNSSTTNGVWLALGVGSATAAVGTSYYIPPGQTLGLVSGVNTFAAVYGVGGAADVYFTPGTGQPLGWGGGAGGAGASAVATAVAPTYTEGTTVNLSTTLSGQLRTLAFLSPTDAANLATIALNSGGLPTGTAPISSAAAESCHALKASPGTLYSLGGYAGQAEWIMIFNATAAPADGAVTPVAWGYAGAAGAYGMSWPVPLTMTVGISVCYSSTGPFTKTAISTNNSFSAQVQ